MENFCRPRSGSTDQDFLKYLNSSRVSTGFCCFFLLCDPEGVHSKHLPAESQPVTCFCVRHRHGAGLRRGVQHSTGAAEGRDEEEDGGVLDGGEGSDGDAGRRAGGGAEERAGETGEEGERAAAPEETQGGLHAVRR